MSDEKEGAVHLSSKGNTLDKMRRNPWIISTVVLAIVALILVYLASSGSLGTTTVSSTTAGANLVSFVNSQGQGTATVVSSEQEGALYKVTVDYKGQNIPVYVTLDGKYLISSPVPLDGTTATNTQQQQTPQDIPKTDKPVVELFVMSYCPYGLQSEKGLLPAIKTLGDKVDFKLKFVSYSMHGKKEVDENLRQYCIRTEQPTKLIDYLSCFAKDGNSDSCLTSVGIDKTKLNACVPKADAQFKVTADFDNKDSYLSGQFPLQEFDAADNTKYGVQGSPTLVINGVQVDSARDSASYLKTICGAFNNAPAACQTQLSAESPGPGFGYTTTGAAAASAAGCAV